MIPPGAASRRCVIAWEQFCHWIGRCANRALHLPPRHCEERKRRSNPSIPAWRGGLLRFARNDGEGLCPPILIRRNLDQTPVRIPAIDRTDRPSRALFCDRAFLDRNAIVLQM